MVGDKKILSKVGDKVSEMLALNKCLDSSKKLWLIYIWQLSQLVEVLYVYNHK